MKVLIYSAHSYEKPLFERCQDHDLTLTTQRLTMDTAGLAEGYTAVAIFSGDKADEQILAALAHKGIRYLTTRSVGHDHVDLTAATDHGIAVANVPVYSPYSVSEHAVCLLLAVVRKLIPAQKLLKEQDFRLPSLMGFDIHGKTVGIIGCGNIGKNIAGIMNGFGCKVIAYDINEEIQVDLPVVFKPFTKVLRQSDILFVSCPLNQSTYHLIGKKELLLMKKEAVLINTARGAVIDTEALVKVLEQGHLRGVGLDVYEYEAGLYFNDFRNKEIEQPFFKELQQFDNVLMTAHQGFLTEEAIEGIVSTTCSNLTEWETHGFCSNDLNPYMYAELEKRISFLT